MSYDGRININDTVVGACPFNFDQHDTNDYYVTFPNDNYFQTKQFYVWWFESNWSVVQQMSKRYGTCCSLLQMAVCIQNALINDMYLTATLFPATILCLLVMLFQLHVTSAEMNVFVFLCQFITCKHTLKPIYVSTLYN